MQSIGQALELSRESKDYTSRFGEILAGILDLARNTAWDLHEKALVVWKDGTYCGLHGVRPLPISVEELQRNSAARS